MRGYLIRYGEDNVCVTNSKRKWLIQNNKRRKEDGEEPENYYDFWIEEVKLVIFKKR